MRDYGDRAGRLPEALVGSEVTVARGLVNSRGRLANATVLNDTQFAWSGGDGGVWGSSQDDGLGSGGVWRIGVWDDPEPAVEGRNLASKNLCSEGKEAQEDGPGARGESHAEIRGGRGAWNGGTRPGYARTRSRGGGQDGCR